MKTLHYKGHITVGSLKKAIKGVPDKTPVYIADHDHGDYETNSIAGSIYLINQKDFDEWTQDKLRDNPEFKIKGEYLVIRP